MIAEPPVIDWLDNRITCLLAAISHGTSARVVAAEAQNSVQQAAGHSGSLGASRARKNTGLGLCAPSERSICLSTLGRSRAHPWHVGLNSAGGQDGAG